MILLGDQDEERMCRRSEEITREIDKFGKVLTIEYGHAIKNASGDGIEHFGYVDGVSQPLFFADELNAYTKNNFGGTAAFDPFAPLSQVLVRDPLAPATEDAYGSYFVFRKLEQNVRGFKKAEEELGKKLYGKNASDEQLEKVGALIIGRFEDGTPIVLSEEDKMIGSGVVNNFNYSGDDEGLKCPFHAHIRKTNPRTQGKIDEHTMARRGITYGIRQVSPAFEQSLAQMPTEGVGLLFMSFQQSIKDQFQFIQRSWANNPGFPQPNTGIDLIMGQPDPNQPDSDPPKHTYPLEWGKGPMSDPHPFQLFVTLKGGEYFFAPSIPFLKKLQAI